tara:strand:- start:21238 stop:21558 length:321 start_codon:yes stop_codon:yes gene_type:complete
MHNDLIPIVQNQYPTGHKRKIAEMCLDLGEEWTHIVGAQEQLLNVNLYSLTAKKSKKECRTYIRKNFDKSQVGSGILLTILISVLINVISSWISTLIIENLVKKTR